MFPPYAPFSPSAHPSHSCSSLTIELTELKRRSSPGPGCVKLENKVREAEEPPALPGDRETKDLGDTCMLDVTGQVFTVVVQGHFIRPHQARVFLRALSFFPCSSVIILILLRRYLNTGNRDGGHEFWSLGRDGSNKNTCQLVLFSAFAECLPSALHLLSSGDSTGK